MSTRYINITTGEEAPLTNTVTRNGKSFKVIGRNEKIMRELGYLPVGESKPESREGYSAVVDGWTEKDGYAVRTYRYVEIPKAKRTVDRVKLLAVCSQMGIWENLKAWMQTSKIRQNGIEIPVWDAFLVADDEKMTEGSLLFDAWFAHAKYALGITDEQGEQILEASKKE